MSDRTAIARHAARDIAQSSRNQPHAATAAWSIDRLLDDLAARGAHPAVIALGETGATVVWDSARLAETALRLARGLRRDGVARGVPVALWASNSPAWIAAALGVLAAGGVLAPLDDQADAEQVEAALACCTVRLILTTAHHREPSGAIFDARGARALLLDDLAETATGGGDTGSMPIPAADDPALLSWTSGTTGSPKGFMLTHRNIASNVEALRDLGVAGPGDRALLPLPLHHAYPFVVGMLTTLTIGTAIVLPGGTTGPLLAEALRDAGVTAIIGVPRLYEALLAAIDLRVNARGPGLRLFWRAMLSAAVLAERTAGLRPGRLFFGPVRHMIGPRLRLLVSGGARLDRATEERLEALGWTVLSGYGLAETASLFTGNRPGARRFGSAGKPLAGGEVRIADPDEDGIGEIELRGRSITKGYLDNPEADRAAFAPGGWFRTGDLGFVDRDGFLFITGRAKEILVLGGGKKVAPEDLERVYAAAPEIAEIALLEDKGALVALVRPDAPKLLSRGISNFRDGIRVALTEAAQKLPSYQRLSGFALTDQPLPRTRLGKYRRFLLPALYARALAGGARRAGHAPTPEDAALLEDPSAAAVWDLLRGRYPGGAVDFDTNLRLDLNVDSFAWMELTTAIEERIGARLSDADIAAAETVRDLLRLAIMRRGEPRAGALEAAAPAADFERWLAPRGALLTALGFAIHLLDKAVMRCLFRLRVSGAANVPVRGACVIAPNHASYLDPLAIAAALPWRRLRNLYWAGDALLLFSHAPGRLFCRAMHVFPVHAARAAEALEAAGRALQAGNAVVWFPEGWRSPDGSLQRFLPGIAEILLRSGAPAVPAHIAGAFEALPRERRIPRLRRISVIFGDAEPVERLAQAGAGGSEEERVATALRERVMTLAAQRALPVERDIRPDTPA